MKIAKIRWITQATLSAELTLTDGTYVCVALCQPCKYTEKDYITEHLRPHKIADLKIPHIEEPEFIKLPESSYGYRVIAQIHDAHKGIVHVGKIYIDLGTQLPAEFRGRRFIEFSCNKFQLW